MKNDPHITMKLSGYDVGFWQDAIEMLANREPLADWVYHECTCKTRAMLAQQHDSWFDRTGEAYELN